MPREAMDYSKCIIYKIVCNDENVLESYVGHTTNFVKRKYNHKSNCKTNNLKFFICVIAKHPGFLATRLLARQFFGYNVLTTPR